MRQRLPSILLLTGLSVAAVPAVAQRPSTLAMTCDAARGVVAAQGAIVLSTGRHTYDRFVATPGFCSFGEWARSATAPTADTAQCPLFYVCQAGDPPWRDDGDGFGGMFGR